MTTTKNEWYTGNSMMTTSSLVYPHVIFTVKHITEFVLYFCKGQIWKVLCATSSHTKLPEIKGIILTQPQKLNYEPSSSYTQRGPCPNLRSHTDNSIMFGTAEAGKIWGNGVWLTSLKKTQCSVPFITYTIPNFNLWDTHTYLHDHGQIGWINIGFKPLWSWCT